MIRNSDGTVNIVLGYTEDLQDKNISVTVDPSQTGHTMLARSKVSSKQFPIKTYDNQGVYVYNS